MIQYLSGIGKAKKTKAERKERRKKIVTKLKENVKNPKKLIAKVGISPARAAFLVAVNLNLLKLAKRLQQAYDKDKKGLQKFWEKFGGDFNTLKKGIEKGSKTKLNGTIGTAAATLATATPIIIATLKFLKQLKSDKEGDTNEDKPVLETLKDSLLDEDEISKKTKDDKPTTDESETPFYKNPLFIGGAVLVAGGGLYLALK